MPHRVITLALIVAFTLTAHALAGEKAGVAIEALDGEKSMAVSENQLRTLAVLELNKTRPEGKHFVVDTHTRRRSF